MMANYLYFKNSANWTRTYKKIANNYYHYSTLEILINLTKYYFEDYLHLILIFKNLFINMGELSNSK